jgi:hypothetical protein
MPPRGIRDVRRAVEWPVVESVPTPNPPGAAASVLSGVTAASATDVWAARDYQAQNGEGTLIEHWDGSTWSLVRGANLPCSGCGGPDAALAGVPAGSATAAWAVGTYFDGTNNRTLIEHWNGHVRRLVPSPNPGLAVGANPVVNTLRSVGAPISVRRPTGRSSRPEPAGWHPPGLRIGVVGPERTVLGRHGPVAVLQHSVDRQWRL